MIEFIVLLFIVIIFMCVSERKKSLGLSDDARMPVNFPHIELLFNILNKKHNNVYLDSTGCCVHLLPQAAKVGTFITILENHTRGWRVNQSADQRILINDLSTTRGEEGYIASTRSYDCIILMCIVEHTTWVGIPMGPSNILIY